MKLCSARDFLLALVAASVGIFVLLYSLPQFLAYASLATVPYSVTEALRNGAALLPDELALAHSKYEYAAGLVPHDAIIQQDLGRLEMRRAYAANASPTERRSFLVSASDRFRAAITAAPARSFPWSLEAAAQSEMSAPPERISDLLRMSYILGPHEASGMLLRARVAGGVWTGLSSEVQDFIRKDYSEIWRYSDLRSSLVSLYIDSSYPARIALRESALQRKKSMLLFDQMVSMRLRQIDRR